MFIFKIFHQIDCCIFAAKAHHFSGIIFGPRRFPVFVLYFGMKTAWNAANFQRTLLVIRLWFFDIEDRKCCPICPEEFFRFRGSKLSVQNRGKRCPIFIKKHSIKSIVVFLLQARTIVVEEFWGPDGFCSCSLFWYENRVKCCPIFRVIFVVVRLLDWGQFLRYTTRNAAQIFKKNFQV